MKLDHLHLHSANVAASQAFYETWFGFQKSFDEEPGVFLKDSDGFLLVIFPVEKGESTIPEWFHFGFSLPSGRDVEGMYERMREAGVPFTNRGLMRFDDAVVFYCLDPDGHKVEVRWEN